MDRCAHGIHLIKVPSTQHNLPIKDSSKTSTARLPQYCKAANDHSPTPLSFHLSLLPPPPKSRTVSDAPPSNNERRSSFAGRRCIVQSGIRFDARRVDRSTPSRRRGLVVA
mmetsp:Transcript_36127/g.76089  ORF Transcript_36127/g.76089 Transcript_36127/m.76089 type:complete len:111 (+) Transcript_36127:283-615(+)